MIIHFDDCASCSCRQVRILNKCTDLIICPQCIPRDAAKYLFILMSLEKYDQELEISATISLLHALSPSSHITINHPPVLKKVLESISTAEVQERLEAAYRINKILANHLDHGCRHLLVQQTVDSAMTIQICSVCAAH